MELAVVSEKDFYKPGAVVYFNRCYRAPIPESDSVAAKDYLYGILLGTATERAPVPAEQVFGVATTFGMVTIDSIFEMLGPEVGHAYVQKLIARLDAQQKKNSLVGPDGSPITSRPRLTIAPPKAIQ